MNAAFLRYAAFYFLTFDTDLVSVLASSNDAREPPLDETLSTCTTHRKHGEDRVIQHSKPFSRPFLDLRTGFHPQDLQVRVP